VINRHLRNFHKDVQFKVRQEWCRDINQQVDGKVLSEPDDVVARAGPPGYIKELPIIDGFNCLHCGYVCGTLGTAQFHARTHGWRVGKDASWKSQHLQVLNQCRAC
jgi:hypothetical protein